MPQTPQVRAVKAIVLGATFVQEDDTADITFVLENGDHLHVILSPSSLHSLCRHIENVADQMHGQIGPAKRNPEN